MDLRQQWGANASIIFMMFETHAILYNWMDGSISTLWDASRNGVVISPSDTRLCIRRVVSAPDVGTALIDPS
jgi:hypothetical protein